MRWVKRRGNRIVSLMDNRRKVAKRKDLGPNEKPPDELLHQEALRLVFL
jgi:hypothetical protein